MSSYSEKLKDPRWQRKRLEVLQRDGFICNDCFSGDKTLHVHHSHYFKGDPWETPSFYLTALCCSCHERRGAAEELLKRELGHSLTMLTLEELENLAATSEHGESVVRIAQITEATT